MRHVDRQKNRGMERLEGVILLWIITLHDFMSNYGICMIALMEVIAQPIKSLGHNSVKGLSRRALA